MPRTVSIGLALLGAAAASQAPEYAQQYRQRLGGAIDELAAMVRQFDTDATGLGLDRTTAIDRLKGNADPVAQKRGAAMAGSVERLDRLDRQRRAMQEAGPLGRILALAEDPDPQVARRALEDFEPAIPTTGEGAAVAGLGFLASYGLLRLVALPFRKLFRRGSEKVRVRA
ncbi:MAG: DUF2937 family protein [Alsobacter sp.]